MDFRDLSAAVLAAVALGTGCVGGWLLAGVGGLLVAVSVYAIILSILLGAA